MSQEEARTVLKVPEVSGCCFYLSLRTGVRIIACLHIFLIGGVFLTAFCWHMITSYYVYVDGQRADMVMRTYIAGFYMEDFTIFEIISTFVFAIFLLHGTFKEDIVYIEPWLILKITSVSLALFNVAMLSVLRFTGHKPGLIIWELFHFALDGYLLIVVLSLYRQYKSNRN